MNNTISTEQLIEKLQWMLPSFVVYNVDELVTHIYDAMRVIGGLKSNTQDTLKLTVTENRCKIPADIEDILEIAFDHKIYGIVPLMKVDNINTDFQLVYMIYNGYIYTDIPNGDIYVRVSILPLDDNGRPLIPNEVYYEKAVLHYLFERLMYKAYLQDQIDERKYERIRQDWLFYCGSAKSASMFMRKDEQNIFNGRTLTVFPKFNRLRNRQDRERFNIDNVPLTNLNELLVTQAIDPRSTQYDNTTVGTNGNN
jgi:hypothetical protein